MLGYVGAPKQIKDRVDLDEREDECDQDDHFKNADQDELAGEGDYAASNQLIQQ